MYDIEEQKKKICLKNTKEKTQNNRQTILTKMKQICASKLKCNIIKSMMSKHVYSILYTNFINEQSNDSTSDGNIRFIFLITYSIHVLKSSENIYSIVLSNEILSLYEYLNKRKSAITCHDVPRKSSEKNLGIHQ
jgi:hypothetical protein